ncbi:ABC transporter substrate-binding protein [Pusillimonas noertemannii]|uniref:ABC transporter substrate-binding protein n=1 Tax=Pusillimonas noertemannii TaxID=305977 RepID=UPI0002E16ECE|nr:ABC transporter substrate-binding protein [Pusillimonas noertemannii]
MFRHTKMKVQVLCAALAIGSTGFAAVAQAADLKVGVIVPLSGPISAQGLNDELGIKAALKYQGSVAGHNIKVIKLDDQSNSALATRNARKLIDQEHVDVLVGAGGVPSSLAIATVATEGKTPLVSFTPIDLTGEKAEWAKTTTQSGDLMVGAVVDEMKRNGVKTVGYIGFSDAWGDSAYAALQKYAEPAGIKIVANERYARTDNSLTAQALKVISARPDAVLGGGAGTPGALPYIALRERGYKGVMYGTYALISPEFVQLVGKAGQGLIVSSGPSLVGPQLPDSNASKKTIAEFNKAFQEVNNSQPNDLFSAYSFDTILVIADAAKRVPSNVVPGTEAYRLALRDELNKTTKLPTTQGLLSYTPASSYGLGKDSVVMLELVDSKWMLRK